MGGISCIEMTVKDTKRRILNVNYISLQGRILTIVGLYSQRGCRSITRKCNATCVLLDSLYCEHSIIRLYWHAFHCHILKMPISRLNCHGK